MEPTLLMIGPDLKTHGIGGVTIHVQRLRDYLDRCCFRYEFKDYKCNSLLTLIKSISRADIIHFHISNPLFLFILVLSSRGMGKTVIMTLHGNYGRFSSFKNYLVRCCIQMANVPIVINQKSYVACQNYNKNICLIPAFIPPQKEELLQDEIVSFINSCHLAGKIVVSTNAYNISFDRYGNEIYGIDFLVNYFEKASGYVLIISDPSGNYRKKYPSVHENVHFIDYPHPYFELLKMADIFVRNTSTDGDALSVKESLYLCKPTLCSDVVDRPYGVSLFRFNDSDSFSRCLKEASFKECIIENGAERILELYKKAK